MPHSQFILRQGSSRALDLFPHIREFGLRKNNNIQLHSFVTSRTDNLRLYFIVDGKFEWTIDREHQVLYPGDTAVVLPGQEIGGSNGYLGIGTFFWLHLIVENISSDGRVNLGKWSSLLESECLALGKILKLNNLPVLKVKEVASILWEMRSEIQSQEIGYITRVNHMLDTLLIIIARQSTRQASSLW